MFYLHLQTIVQVLYIRLKLYILRFEPLVIAVLLRVLDLEDVELALLLLQCGFDLLNLSVLQEFVPHLLHLGPQVTNSPLQLVPLNREL